MFFNKKKKPKLDPKVRFQNKQFNQKLNEARTFKRTARPIPEGGFERFLRRVGLGSIWRQIFFALLVLGAVYLVYAPNFLSVQSIKVEGLAESELVKVQTAIQDDLNKVPFYNPQRNLLFLSKARVNKVLSQIPGIDRVENLDKQFKEKTLLVTLRAKHEKFLVRSNDSVFDIYNDGLLKGPAGLNYDAWLSVQNPRMIKVDLGAKISELPQDSKEIKQFFSNDTVAYMTEVNEALKGIVGSPLAYFSVRIPQLVEQQEFIEANLPTTPEEELTPEDVPDEALAETEIDQPLPEVEEVPVSDIEVSLPINADELNFVFQKGTNSMRTFNVIVDTKENPDQLVQRLNLLLSQTAPDRYNNLFYIDLRIQTRAFVCLLNSPCIR